MAVAVVDIQVNAGGASQQLRNLNQQSQQLQTAVNGATTAVTKQGRELQTAANGMKYFTDAAGRARAENGRLLTTAERAAAGIRNQGQAAQSAGGGFSSLAGIVGRLGIALSAIGTARFIFAKTAELETQTRSIQVLTGSVQQAKQIISELQQLGAVTPFTSTELIDAAKRLQAFGVEAKNVVDTTRRLADVAGATGAELQGLVTAYGQVQAKGRLQGEELLQFQERGIALQGELRKMYGMTGEEFQKALSKGQISAQAVEVAIVRLTEKGGKYANGAIAQSDTLAGKFSTLQDGVDQVAREIGTNLTPALKGALDVAIDLVTRMGQAFAASSISEKDKQSMLSRVQGSLTRDFGPMPGGPFGMGEVQMKFGGKIYRGQPAEVTAQITNAMINAEVNRRAQVNMPPTPKRQVTTTPLALLTPTTATGGGAGSGKAKAGDSKAAAAKAALATSQLQLSQARALFDVEGRILEARGSGNRQLEITRQAQAELLRINFEAQRLKVDKEMPAAQKKAELDKLAIKAASTARQLEFDINAIRKEDADLKAQGIRLLNDELDLQQARLNGNEAEVILNQQIRDLKAQFPPLNEADIRTTLAKTKALKAQADAAEQLKQVYADIGMSIKSGVVDAIQGAIDGTKSLQQVAVDLLNSIANKLLDIAVNMALFGTMSGTGTGGGLLGGLFRANGGSVSSGQPYIVGERGPELFMPGRSGTIIPNHNLGGGAISVVVNVDASGSSVSGDQAQGKQLGMAVSAAVQAELIKQKRPGGLLA